MSIVFIDFPAASRVARAARFYSLEPVWSLRHGYVKKLLDAHPSHYREWFIDEDSDPAQDTVIIAIGIRGVGIVDIEIPRSRYDRAKVLAQLRHEKDSPAMPGAVQQTAESERDRLSELKSRVEHVIGDFNERP